MTNPEYELPATYTVGEVEAGPPCCEPVPHLSIANLSVAYGSTLVLDKVSLDIYQGCITALIGPSGCGKTSFLSALNRLTDLIPGAQVSGGIQFENSELLDPQLDVLALRRRIGMIFQKPNPFPLSIRRNLELPLREHGVRRRKVLEERIETGSTSLRWRSPAANSSGCASPAPWCWSHRCCSWTNPAAHLIRLPPAWSRS